MPHISNLIGRVEFPLQSVDIQNAILNRGIPECTVCFAELPGYKDVDVLYIYEFPKEYRWKICQIVMGMFEVFDHDFESNDYHISNTITS